MSTETWLTIARVLIFIPGCVGIVAFLAYCLTRGVELLAKDILRYPDGDAVGGLLMPASFSILTGVIILGAISILEK